MTPADLERKSEALEALRATFEADLVPEVANRVADAHAHALKALTQTLKNTQDGRPSILAINRSPSFLAANARLDELWAWLAGRSEISLKGKIRDAREKLYGKAAKLWFPLVPANIRSRSTATPTLAQVLAIRAAAIHGYDPRKALQGSIEDGKRTLKASLEQAGRRSTPEHVEGDLLLAWERRTASNLARTVVTLLNDSCEYADRMAGRDLINEKFLESTPIEGREAT